MDMLKRPDMSLEYDRMMEMTPEERATDASNQLVLRPDFGGAERDAGMMGNAERVINRDASEVMRAQGMKPRRRM
jgi:hypothetical protein